nr:hypothetical protein GCM10020093_037260 [Planobispora longispora]
MDDLVAADDRERFEFGLDLMLRGLASYAAEAGPASGGPENPRTPKSPKTPSIPGDPGVLRPRTDPPDRCAARGGGRTVRS